MPVVFSNAETTNAALGNKRDIIKLFRKLANISADLPSKRLDDNGIFKTLTGEDCITGEIYKCYSCIILDFIYQAEEGDESLIEKIENHYYKE